MSGDSEAAGARQVGDPAWERALALLEGDLMRRDAAARTRRAYLLDTRQFARWCAARQISPAQAGPKVVRRYVASLSEAGLAPASCARKLASLRALFESARQHGLIAHNPADLVATPRRGAALPRVLSAREAARLLDGIPAADPLEARDRAIFELAYSCGLRAEEIVSLRLEDVDHDAEQLRVEGKGRKTRVLPVGEPAMAAVQAYLERARPGPERSGGGHPSALPEQDRKGARDERRAPAAAPLEPARWARRLLAARPAPQLRHAPARRRRRSALDPGAARARERVEHPDLHARGVRAPAARLRAEPSAGVRRALRSPAGASALGARSARSPGAGGAWGCKTGL